MAPQARLYTIKSPQGTKPDDFASFIAKDVFPTVPQGPTRGYHVTSQRLFHDSVAQDQYLWLIELEYDYGGAPEGEALNKLKAFGADVQISSYAEQLSWPGDSGEAPSSP